MKRLPILGFILLVLGLYSPISAWAGCPSFSASSAKTTDFRKIYGNPLQIEHLATGASGVSRYNINQTREYDGVYTDSESTPFVGFTANGHFALGFGFEVAGFKLGTVSGSGTATNPYILYSSSFWDRNQNNTFDSNDIRRVTQLSYVNGNDYVEQEVCLESAASTNTDSIIFSQGFDSHFDSSSTMGAAFANPYNPSNFYPLTPRFSMVGALRYYRSDSELAAFWDYNQQGFWHYSSDDYQNVLYKLMLTGTLDDGLNTNLFVDSGVAVQWDYGVVNAAVTKKTRLLFTTLNKLTNIVGTDSLDFGDAPDLGAETDIGDYQTYANNLGAAHRVPATGAVNYLGTAPDVDVVAHTDVNAAGDAHDDGVLVAGKSLQGVSLITASNPVLTINTVGTGKLYAWLDWNRDGDFLDANEQVANGVSPSAGVINLALTVPSQVNTGMTVARFRFAADAAANSSLGIANDGEVEDYQVQLLSLLSNPPTPKLPACSIGQSINLVKNSVFTDLSSWGMTGAWQVSAGFANLSQDTGTHTLSQTLTGWRSGPSSVGGVHVNAKVRWTNNNYPLSLGAKLVLSVGGVNYAELTSAGGKGSSASWVFLNGAQSGLPGAAAQVVPANTWTNLSLDLPADLTNTSTLLLTATVNSTPSDDMAVDDIEVLTCGQDHGDLPLSFSYGTASHQLVTGMSLGPTSTAELADFNDINAATDQDDGVTLAGSSLQGQTLSAETVSKLAVDTRGVGKLYGWIDWNQSGAFENNEEITGGGLSSNGGVQTLTITVPANIANGTSYARFRYSSDVAAAMSSGAASDGEVEDYLVNLRAGAQVKLKLKLLLQGAYDETSQLMRDDLRATGLLPLQQPYASLGNQLSYQGIEVTTTSLLASTGNDAPVDWVLVQLRDKSAPNLVKTTLAALVQRDGDVVDPVTNDTVLRFYGVPAGNYYLAVAHRQHLPIVTATAWSFSSTPVLVDLRSSNIQTLGNNARLDLHTASVLWVGDIDQGGNIVLSGPENDANKILAAVLIDPNNQQFNSNFVGRGYSIADLNMDGKVIFAGPGNDLSVILANILRYPSNSTQSANYVIRSGLEQVYPAQ